MPRRRHVSWASRVTLWIGTLMMLVGAVLLGYVGWQFWGTNWTSSRAQKQVTHDLQAQWRRGQHLTRLEPQYVPKGKASALVRIPAFGKKYVVPVLEGTSQDVLAKGYGHFSHTANPGQVGNYALAAHRVTHGQPLNKMPTLHPGNKVIVETATATYTYRLDTDPNSLIVPFTSGWVLDTLPRNPRAGGVQPTQRKGQRLITLTTCSELFHTDNRMIAFGHLVATSRKS